MPSHPCNVYRCVFGLRKALKDIQFSANPTKSTKQQALEAFFFFSFSSSYAWIRVRVRVKVRVRVRIRVRIRVGAGVDLG